ncbi:MAG: hypothetical protein ACRDQA_02800, partial [Nocardioidaceae bacterium]
MGRIRTIKPEFFESESVTELPIRARLTWIGLWTHCDDHGRAKANAKLIKAAVWPLDKISLNEVEKDLDDLEALCLIVRYEVSGKNYLAVTNWDEHQAAAYRRGEAKYPPPPTFNGDVQKSASRTVAEVNQHESPANKGMQKSASRTQMRAGTGNREQGTGNR